ncbi:MAG: leucine-rich repeat domain-containing protein, partial [Alkalispirochaeta sp.]
MKRLRRLLIGSVASLLILTASYWVLTSLVQESPFADQALEAAVRDQIGTRGGYIPRNELEGLTELDASGRGIESLEGIEMLPNLRRLNLSGNRVEDVEPLTSLTRLTMLDVQDNYIANLEAVNFHRLADLPELSELVLRSNRESAHPEDPDGVRRISDISVLSEFRSLEVLDLANNHVEDISPLSRLESLRVLNLQGNRLTENALEPLRDLARLEHLNLRENDLRELDPLSSLGQLEYLNLHSNDRIDSIVPIASLTALRTLILRGVSVDGQEGIFRELTNLERLNLRDTGLRDLSALVNLMERGALQDRPEDDVFAEVDIRENPIESTEAYHVLEPYWAN